MDENGHKNYNVFIIYPENVHANSGLDLMITTLVKVLVGTGFASHC